MDTVREETERERERKTLLHGLRKRKISEGRILYLFECERRMFWEKYVADSKVETQDGWECREGGYFGTSPK